MQVREIHSRSRSITLQKRTGNALSMGARQNALDAPSGIATIQTSGWNFPDHIPTLMNRVNDI